MGRRLGLLAALVWGAQWFLAAGSDEFDFLMFTQLWPVTSCLTWEDKSTENTCTIEGWQNHWTIHGIWPTRNNQIGPLFCNRSAQFDPSSIVPLMPELVDKWTDVRNTKEKYDFWRHEWLKHGTCAMQIPSMNTEVKYFQKALELHKEYNIFQLLQSAGISPGRKYHPEEIWNKLNKELAIRPAINCAHDSSNPNAMIYEVIVCLDKDFKKKDCDNTKGGLYGSCPRKPSAVLDYPTLPSKINLAPYAVLVFFMVPLLVVLIFWLRKHYLRRSMYERLGDPPPPNLPILPSTGNQL